jgi:hypothetical protein
MKSKWKKKENSRIVEQARPIVVVHRIALLLLDSGQTEVQLFTVGEPGNGGKVGLAAELTAPAADQEGDPLEVGWDPFQIVAFMWKSIFRVTIENNIRSSMGQQMPQALRHFFRTYSSSSHLLGSLAIYRGNCKIANTKKKSQIK